MTMFKEDTLKDVFGFIADMKELHPEASVELTAVDKYLSVTWVLGDIRCTKEFDPKQADFHLYIEKVHMRELLRRAFRKEDRL